MKILRLIIVIILLNIVVIVIGGCKKKPLNNASFVDKLTTDNITVDNDTMYNTSTDNSSINSDGVSSYELNTLLHEAVRDNNLAEVKKHINQGANINDCLTPTCFLMNYICTV